MKTRKMYQVRYFGKKGSVYSTGVGFKCRLLDRARALRLVRRLKLSGVDAIASPVRVAA